MKIRHSIIRDWTVLRGYIEETIFEKGESRGDEKQYYSKDGEFYIMSCWGPQLCRNRLYVFWRIQEYDNKEIDYIYFTEQEAQRVLDYINEFTVQEEVEPKKEERKIVITDITEDNKLEVLKKIEEEYPDVRWWASWGNARPTDKKQWNNGERFERFLIENDVLFYWFIWIFHEDSPHITAQEFLWQSLEKPKQDIFKNKYYVG